MEDEHIIRIMNDCERALQNTMVKVEKLLKNTISEKVYKPRIPKVYVRSHTFENAWYVGQASRHFASVSQNLEYEPTRMGYSGSLFIHGNGSRDRRNIMASILEKQEINTQNSDFGGALNIPKDDKEGYWEVFKKELDTELYKYLDKELGKYGIRRC